MLRAVVVTVACAALIVGCGGGDSGGLGPQTVIENADQQRAETALLTLSDFPSGWTGPTDDEDEEGIGELECLEDLEPDLSELTVTGKAETGNFDSDGARVSSSAIVYRTGEEAREAFESGRDTLMRDDLPACFTEAFAEGFAQEETDVEVDVGEVSANAASLPAVAEQSVAFQFEIPLEVDGQAVSSFMELVAVREDRVIGSMFTVNFGAPFPPDEMARLAGIIGERLQ